jgi:putative ABC transport system permease protein
MNLLIPFKIAYQALRKHKVRTALTISGVVIGIAAVIMVMAAGEGINNYITDQINSFGTNIIEVEVKTPNVGKTSMQNVTSLAQGLTITTLQRDDAAALAKLPYVDKISVCLMDQEVFNYQGDTAAPIVFGTDENFLDVYKLEVAAGENIQTSDVDSQARVVILGSELKEKLFGNATAVGENIRIRNRSYRVIGVLEPKGDYFGMNLDLLALLPVTTLQKQVMGVDYLSFIIAWLTDDSYIERGVLDFTDIMRAQHNYEENDPDRFDFSVVTMQEAAETMNGILGGISLLLIVIAGISLLVGGVGIMNIMYVSVTERTYEIGLRKAVGATRKNILTQFLYEAGLITFAGGVIGIILGILLALGVSVVAQYLGLNWRFSLPPESIIISVAVAVGIGLLFGLYPARRAATLDPINALRK